MKILACNVGSTSLKFKLFDMPAEQVTAECRVERVGSADNAIFSYTNCLSGGARKLERQCIPTYTAGIRLFLDFATGKEYGVLQSVADIERVGFKTVLGKNCHGVFELTPDVLDSMRAYLFVAPAHNGPYLEAIAEFKQLLPNAAMIGVFETAFHRTIPQERRLYAIPYEWYETYGIQRFGYHGASHGYIADAIAQAGGGRRVISCHLGGSCSICAILDGKSVDNSFGFSLQTGIFHANRVGDLDAYIIPFLENEGLPRDEILDGLSKKGGMLGISGISNDMRDIEDAEESNPRAKLAIDMFSTAIVRYIGSYYAELGGLDHLVFTGGIGEKSPIVRGRVCGMLAHMGVLLDEARNASGPKERIISADHSPVSVHIIPANEELGIARRTYEFQV